jgi:hypothetical protein
MEKKSYRLFLDDIRMPEDVGNYIDPRIAPLYRKEEWVIVRNYEEFVNHITENGMPFLVSFDHDLADEHYRPSMYNPDGHYSNYYSDGTFEEKTGYCAAKWMIEYIQENSLSIPDVICHSMNPIGKKNILDLIENFKKYHEGEKM